MLSCTVALGERSCLGTRPMQGDEYDAALLIADITGSTPLYEKVGDAGALALVAECLDTLRSIVAREGGKFIRSKGDDVLSAFSDPADALRTARKMRAKPFTEPLAIHIGIHFGHVIHARGDLFGDAVNLTARLASVAKSGEVLVSRPFVDRLPKLDTASLRLLDNITFKGKSVATEVYALLDENAADQTQIAYHRARGQTRNEYQQSVPNVSLVLNYQDRSWTCEEGEKLSIGRSEGCDVVINQVWVSRNHLTVTVRWGKVQLTDQSSSGTYVSIRDGYDFFMRRETVLLTGSGILSPAVKPEEPTAEVIHYEVVLS